MEYIFFMARIALGNNQFFRELVNRAAHALRDAMAGSRLGLADS